MTSGFDRVVVTCEHGGNRIPAAYRAWFAGGRGVLDSHRGWDIGALGVARSLSSSLGAPLYFTTVSRLLVDVNRSVGHRAVFSDFVSNLEATRRARILEEHYWPYREAVERHLWASVRAGRSVLHLSVHSFTPVLDGRIRDADVGLLYDPSRRSERDFALRFRAALRRTEPSLRVRRNYPYRGTADGFTTYLRSVLRSPRYAGLEIELNQTPLTTASRRGRMAAILYQALVSME